AFLDGLAVHRRAQGLAGQSLAWGLWEQTSGMTEELSDTDRRRIDRVGVTALTAETALALFDSAVEGGGAALVPMRFDPSATPTTEIPDLLRRLVRGSSRRIAGLGPNTVASLGHRLAGLSLAEQDELLLDVVRAQVAEILGHASADAIEPDRAFNELGFDSLTAVEFRNQLNEVTGLRLPPTLVFDYPTSKTLASHLGEELAPDHHANGDDGAEEQRIRRILQDIPFSRLRDAGLMQTLLELSGAQGEGAEPAGAEVEGEIDEMDTESLISMALGGSGYDDAIREV
ncbi:beta-ketoacyl reductase, partial [Streptomyces sp. NPDC048484]|uniref:beta-ketoacyl reductase n=1 Tax=Streptomyces sp. NPDC048484 TaxID=3155146 RepID=UPI00344794C7